MALPREKKEKKKNIKKFVAQPIVNEKNLKIGTDIIQYIP